VRPKGATDCSNWYEKGRASPPQYTSIMLSGLLTTCVLALALTGRAEPPSSGIEYDNTNRPDLAAIVASPRSEMIGVIDRFEADEGAIERKYPLSFSPVRIERLRTFRTGWLDSLAALDFERLSRPGQVDWLLLRNRIRRDLRRAELEAIAIDEAASLLPNVQGFIDLVGSRERIPALGAGDVAERLHALRTATAAAESSLAQRLRGPSGEPPKPAASTCRKALLLLRELRGELHRWRAFRAGYDPSFSWWTESPWEALSAALDGFERVLREEGVGQTPANPNVIVGTPVGRDALVADLAFEWIAYSPEELLQIADREFAWCETELRKAAAELGCGDDWKDALEAVKSKHVDPGEQPALIRRLADEAVSFLRDRDLVTVPTLAEETWRMEMMSPERQLMTPFFTGGEVISIAFPTDGMSHEQKVMSLRGNNVHFAHATVFHELIPGHHLQQFAQARFQSQRRPFATPFWTEGWALHWEMLLWDLGFDESPEDRIGALFWRAHRAARIIFSLRFHLGEMSAQECVDFLVDRVGHERANAEGEVRRAVSGDYPPLYQIAYMIGGLQFRALHRDLVYGGRMTQRDFHDAVLAESNIPVEFVRMLLTNEIPSRDRGPSWRFAGEMAPTTQGGTSSP
jgi:hypothetical protein